MRHLLARYPTSVAVVVALITLNVAAGILSEHSGGAPVLVVLRLVLAPFALAQTALIVVLRLIGGDFPAGFPLPLRLLLLAGGIAPYSVLDWLQWYARKGKGRGEQPPSA